MDFTKTLLKLPWAYIWLNRIQSGVSTEYDPGPNRLQIIDDD